jgi:hypothetical protein
MPTILFTMYGDEAIKTEVTIAFINLGVAKNVSLSTPADKAHEFDGTLVWPSVYLDL